MNYIVRVIMCGLFAALAACSEADTKAQEQRHAAVARTWADRLGVRVKGLECNWGGYCTMVTESEVVAIKCYEDRCYRETCAK